MINLTRCELCTHPNYLEHSALSLHRDLQHVIHLADALTLLACQTPEHDDHAGPGPVRAR
jgi:hypothetical protein